MATLNREELHVQTKSLFTPKLQEVVEVLQRELEKNYHEVEVDIVDCPDLTQAPFNLASSGLNGNPRLVEVGGPSYVVPYADLTKMYELTDIPHLVDLDSAFIIGASAGSHTIFGGNSECIIDIYVKDENVKQQTKLCKFAPNKEVYVQEFVPKHETRFTFLGNFFVTEGKPGPVLKVHVRKRIGKYDFVSSIREALSKEYENEIIGLGGTFLIKKGQVSHHLMPQYFSEVPLNSQAEVDKWFRFLDMSAPLTTVGTLVTQDYGMDLREHHFHSFSDHGDGGHYHIDTTPDIVEYEGYFNIAECVYRIDQPDVLYQNGRG